MYTNEEILEIAKGALLDIAALMNKGLRFQKAEEAIRHLLSAVKAINEDGFGSNSYANRALQSYYAVLESAGCPA